MAYESLEAAVEQIKKIDNNDQLYLKMLREPWFKDGIEPSWLSESHYRRFLSSIFDQPPEQAFRRNRGRWGAKYEQRLATAFFKPHLQVAHSLRFFKRRRAAQRTPYQWQPVPDHVTADTLCLDNTELATPRGVAGPCSAR
jgi:hypothetical protein